MLHDHKTLRTLPVLLSLVCSLAAIAQTTDPRITSWLPEAAGNYARLYKNDADKISGTASTTWSRGAGTQSSPAYAGVTQVKYSATWAYLRSTGLGYHVMGPWYMNTAHTQDFANYPANQNVLYRIPRVPSVPTTKTLTSAGVIGYGVDGVALFDNRDTFSYSTASAADADPTNGMRGDGVWNRDAFINEGVTFDPAFAHQAMSNYHYHANTPALRFLLGDHVSFSATTKAYTESSDPVTAHSPILAWMADGYPVYGPYGYATAMSATSGVKRMISGYVKRDGSNGTTNLSVTGRTSLPTWAVKAQSKTSAALASSQYGPAVNPTYVLGHFLEDYDYLGDLGQTQGTVFDLDQYNGRFCVTPEFPNGTYAYFITIEPDGTPKYPYIIGRWYYGSPTGGAVSSISETVTEYDRGAPAAAITLSGTASGSKVTLAWNSDEGATYKMEASSDGMSWSVLSSAILSGSLATSYSADQANYYRVTLTAIATYDTNGTVGVPVGTTTTLHYTSSGSQATGTASADTTTTSTTTTTTTAAPPPPPTSLPTAPTTTTTTTTTTTASGGGGAPSQWFLGALALLVGLRRLRCRLH
jgi:hypothetical protein